jgi:hypothetical protein
MYARVQTLRLSRPSGTVGISCSRQTSDKSLGYCQLSLRDDGPALPVRKSSPNWAFSRVNASLCGASQSRGLSPWSITQIFLYEDGPQLAQTG